jgi:hypothetical protein
LATTPLLLTAPPLLLLLTAPPLLLLLPAIRRGALVVARIVTTFVVST